MRLLKRDAGKREERPVPPLVLDEATLSKFEELRAHAEETNDDHIFLQEHLNRLVAEHPNRWVAAYRGEIVGIYDTVEEIRDMAREMGIPDNRIAAAFLYWSEKPLNLARMAG